MLNPLHLLNAVLFAVLGLAVLVAALTILIRLLPRPLWQEILERQNTALAILAGAVALGVAIIVAAAMH